MRRRPQNREQGMGNRERATANREQGMGNRERAARNTHRVAGMEWRTPLLAGEGPRGGEGFRFLARGGSRGGPLRLAFLFAVITLAASSASAQVLTGIPPFSSATPSAFDRVDNANLNVHFAIPVFSRAGRASLGFSYVLSYDNSIWQPLGTWYPNVPNWGWRGTAGGLMGYAWGNHTTNGCYNSQGKYSYDVYGPWTYQDAQGTLHYFQITVSDGQSTPCSGVPPYSQTLTATDGSGWTMTATAAPSATLTSPSGLVIVPPIGTDDPTSGSGSITDANGNAISGVFSASSNSFYDTLSSTTPALRVDTSQAPGTIKYTYTGPGISGDTPVSYTATYTQQTVQTNFGCSGIIEYGATQQYLVSSITLPDKSTYTFSYEPTYNYPTSVTGRIAEVTLPTGGIIKYAYSGGSQGITCADGSTATLTRTVYPDGVTPRVRTYAHLEGGSAWTTNLTAPADPQGNEAYTAFNFQGVYETEREVYQKQNGTLLETVNTCYNRATIPCNSTGISLPISNITSQITLPSLSPSETYTTLNSYGWPTERDEYDWEPTLVRKTITTYGDSSCGVTNPNVIDRPCTVEVEDSGSNPKAQASFTYDANGNLKTETRTNTTGSPSSISRGFSYDSYGGLETASDFNGKTTTYSNTYCNNSFPASITPAISALAVNLQWDCNGAVVTQVTDPNSQITTFSYDGTNAFWRPAGIGYPDRGSDTITYTDTQGAFTVANSRLVSSTLGNHTVTQYLDGLGRVEKSVDTQACSEVDASYDSLGRVYTVSNPYCTTSSGATTYGYDALGRVNSVEAPDGGTTSTSFAGSSSTYCSTVSDPAGKVRKLCSDGLGRITSVTEDPSGLNYQTTYTYDALNDLTGVSQGSQTRTYNYDMLARLTSVKTPEEVSLAGTQCSTTYGYDANGNVISKKAPLENQNLTCSTTVTTTYAYDALNRLTSKTYSDKTPAANFFYDQAPSSWPAWSGVSFSNARGRLVLACTNSPAGTCSKPATATAYSYDPMGRTNNFWQCNPSNCGSASIWNIPYTYDLAGDVTSYTHPGGYSISTPVNAAQQVTSVQSTWNPQYLAQNITYTPWGAVSGLQNGCTGSGCVNTLRRPTLTTSGCSER